MQLVSFELRENATDPRPHHHSMAEHTLGFETLESTTPGTRRLGALIQLGRHAGSVVDLNRALAVKLAAEDAGAPEAEADSLVPSDMLTFLRCGARALEDARAALDFALDALDQFDAPDLRRAGIVEPRRAVRLCAPVPRPGKILAVAQNYAADAKERGGTEPEQPILCLKAPTSVIGPDDEIKLPSVSQQVDFEGELAAVIGRTARSVSPEAALDHIVGYCIANDVTARDFENQHGQRFIGKSCDSFAPMGPALVTTDEVPDPQDLGIRTTVSGEVMQSARTKEMIFPVADLVSFASRLLTLEPGDVILTGTPSGVGAARKPPRWLSDGDMVEIAVERLGRLHNYVRRA